MPGPIRISIVADARNAISGMEATESRAKRMGDAVNKAAKAAALGFAAVGAGAFKLALGAIEDEAAAAKLAQTLTKTTGATSAQVSATEDWISAQGKALGITDDELRPALGTLANATGDLGSAQKLASLAMDISARSGKSLSSVTNSLAKAQTGTLGGLSKYGVSLKDASGETKSLADLTGELSTKFAGSAQTQAETTAGKFQRLKVQLAEAGEAIGAKLIPAFTKAADYITSDVIPAVEKTVGWFKEHQTVTIVLASVIGGFGAALIVASIAMKVYAAGAVIVSAATKAWAAAQWLINAAMTANPIGLIVLGIAALVGGLILAYKKSETFRDIVNGAFAKVKEVITSVVEWFKEWVPPVFSVVADAVKLYVKAWGKAFDIVKGVIKRIIEAIKTIIEGVIATIQKVIEKIEAAITKAKELAGMDPQGTGSTDLSDLRDKLTAPPPPRTGGRPEESPRAAPGANGRGGGDVNINIREIKAHDYADFRRQTGRQNRRAQTDGVRRWR